MHNLLQRMLGRAGVYRDTASEAPEGGAAEAPESAPAPAPESATPAPESAAPEKDEFAAAFEEFSDDKPAPNAAPAAKPAADEPAAPTAEQPAPEAAPTAPEGSQAAAPQGEPAPESKPAEAAPAPAALPTPEQWSQMQAELRELRERATAPAAPEPQSEPQPAPAPLFSQQEEQTLREFSEQWPDIDKAMGLLFRAHTHSVLNHAFAEVRKYVQPVMDAIPEMHASTRYRDLVDAVPDYDAVYDPVSEWVDNMPEGRLKAAYEDIRENGSVEDVAEMIATFKKATGWQAPAPATPAATPAAAAATSKAGMAPPAGKAAPAAPAAAAAPAKPAGKAAPTIPAGLKPVSAERSGPQGAKDPNDYEGAWAEAERAGL